MRSAKTSSLLLKRSIVNLPAAFARLGALPRPSSEADDPHELAEVTACGLEPTRDRRAARVRSPIHSLEASNPGLKKRVNLSGTRLYPQHVHPHGWACAAGVGPRRRG